jgi:putative transposase
VGVEQEVEKPELTGETIGIDLGIKELATVSSMDKPIANINKTAEVRRLKKKLKRKQRQISRKYEKNKIKIERAYKFTKTKNIERLEREARLIHRRLGNIRLNHIHQATTKIAKTKPSRVVVEDLNVRGMMKNRHLSRAIAEQCFGMFVIILTYKCKMRGIELVEADRYYPSSKRCSRCGEVKRDLKLKDRVFVCPRCGFTLDRDMCNKCERSSHAVHTNRLKRVYQPCGVHGLGESDTLLHVTQEVKPPERHINRSSHGEAGRGERGINLYSSGVSRFFVTGARC